MFGFLKSGMKSMQFKMFAEDFKILQEDMSIEAQRQVHTKMSDSYHLVIGILQNDSENAKQRIAKIAKISMDLRNAASEIWKDKRNPDWMAPNLIEHLCNAILSEDVEQFRKVGDPLYSWFIEMESD